MRSHNLGNFKVESALAHSSFETNMAEKIREIKQILPRMSQTFRRCDPPTQEEGTTYIRMTNFLQVRQKHPKIYYQAYFYITDNTKELGSVLQ